MKNKKPMCPENQYSQFYTDKQLYMPPIVDSPTQRKQREKKKLPGSGVLGSGDQADEPNAHKFWYDQSTLRDPKDASRLLIEGQSNQKKMLSSLERKF